MNIAALDHLVLTVADIDETVEFYRSALGMSEVTFGSGRKALSFGAQKINLHQQDHEFEPKAATAAPGAADLCFLTDVPLPDVENHLRNLRIEIIEGPVTRTGATGPLWSLYIRDPDGNLIEISNKIYTQV